MNSEQNGKRKLPEGWEWVKLGEICEQDRQIIESSSELLTKRPYLSLEHIESNTGRILREPMEKMEDEGKSVTFAFDSRHVLYGKLRPYLNKVALPEFEGRCTTEAIPLLPRETVDREFLAWILRREETVTAIMRQKTGSRMPRADMDDLLSFHVPLPPLPEQQRIIKVLKERLTFVEKAQVAAKERLDAGKALLGALLREVFESEEPQEWEEEQLGEISIISTGTTPSTDRKDYYEGLNPFIRTAEIANNRITSTTTMVSDQALQDYGLKVYPKGTVLMAMYGQGKTRGQTAILDVAASTTQNAAAIVPGPRLHSEYLWLWLRSLYERLRKMGYQGDLSHLSLAYVKKLTIPLPSVDRQGEIAEKLNQQLFQAEQGEAALVSQLAAIETLPTALLRIAFNGEL